MAVIQSTMMPLGTTAPDFTLQDAVSGKTLSLAELKSDKATVVMFICNHCPFVIHIRDQLAKVATDFHAKGVSFIAINSNDVITHPQDGPEHMKEMAQETGFSFPYLFDDGQEVFPVFGATKTPHVYLLDQDLVVQYIGAIDDNTRDSEGVEVKYVENAIAALQAGKSPEITNTKAIGCSIKSKLNRSKAKRAKKAKT